MVHYHQQKKQFYLDLIRFFLFVVLPPIPRMRSFLPPCCCFCPVPLPRVVGLRFVYDCASYECINIDRHPVMAEMKDFFRIVFVGRPHDSECVPAWVRRVITQKYCGCALHNLTIDKYIYLHQHNEDTLLSVEMNQSSRLYLMFGGSKIILYFTREYSHSVSR